MVNLDEMPSVESLDIVDVEPENQIGYKFKRITDIDWIYLPNIFLKYNF